jgi:translation initiation factor IF-3
LGVKPLPEALHIARQADLDLVEVAPMGNPPVCRIMDYGRFKYENEQRAKESRRKTTNVSIKEMKYRPKIGPGDFETKTRQVGKFLGQGHKVKITIMFRGREMSHQELGLKILNRVAEEVGSVAKVEAAPKVDGRNMIMVLAPDKRAQAAAHKEDAAAARNDEAAAAVSGDAVAVATNGTVTGPESEAAEPAPDTTSA